MPASLNSSFAEEFPKLVEKAAEDLAQLLSATVTVDCGKVPVISLDEYQLIVGGAVCCRSMFTRKASGIGGLMVPEEAATACAQAILPETPEEFEFDGVTSETMQELWNVFIGSWNAGASPDYRMSAKTVERCVDHYSEDEIVPPEAGVAPYVISFTVKINSCETMWGFFPPIRDIQGDLQGFEPAHDFVTKEGHQPVGDPAADLALEESEAALARAEKEPPKPVIFVDYSGQLLQWIRTMSRSNQVQCVMSEAPPAEETPPAATVVVGVRPQDVEQVTDCSYVEIHPRK